MVCTPQMADVMPESARDLALREFLAISMCCGGLREPKLPTLIDYSVVVLYALLVAVVVAKFIWGFRKNAQ